MPSLELVLLAAVQIANGRAQVVEEEGRGGSHEAVAVAAAAARPGPPGKPRSRHLMRLMALETT